MPRCAVVAPDVVRLPLAEGDWIDVKKQLNAGERARLSGAGLEAVRATGPNMKSRAIELNYERLELARIEAYVVKWSFVGLDNEPLKVTPEAIAALDPAIAKEIDAALDKHVEAAAAEKNGKAPDAGGEKS